MRATVPGPAAVASVAVVVLAGLVLTQAPLVPLVLAVGLSYLLMPLVDRLARTMPRWLATVLALAAVVLLAGLGIRLAILLVAEQVLQLVSELPALLEAVYERLAGTLPVPEAPREPIERATGDLAVRLALGSVAAIDLAIAILGAPLVAFFLLRDRDTILGYIHRSAGRWREDAVATLRIADRVLGGWLRGELASAAVVGVAIALGLVLLGLALSPGLARFAVALGIIAGITSPIPMIGPLLGAIPAVAVALTTSPLLAVAVAALYGAIHHVEGNVIGPQIVGTSLRLHPIVVIVGIVVGAALFGLAGAILAAPTVAFARALYRYVDARAGGLPPDAAYPS